MARQEDTGEKIALIIGAGPAGLTAAYELLTRTDIRPVVVESADGVGGLARTYAHHGNRLDIGGHRFFTKSDRVLKWWLDMLPLQRTADDLTIGYRRATRELAGAPEGPDPATTDDVMLVIPRLTRICSGGKFFDYPISLSMKTLRTLGLARSLRIGASYLHATLRPREEKSLEDFIVNRFGTELYRSFFKSYTEKVWGVLCTDLPPDWGRQRIKGLSIMKTVLHALRLNRRVETSLIEQFLYPKFGAGHMWETAAKKIRALGGEVRLGTEAVGMTVRDGKVTSVRLRERATGRETEQACDYAFSTMPISALAEQLRAELSDEELRVARGLRYRDFIIVGLLLKRLEGREQLKDNWIYVQDDRVQIGRLDILNNWGGSMVADPGTVYVGAEYFCQEGDAVWSLTDAELRALAESELRTIGLIREGDVLDGTVVRIPKAYPSYVGTYGEFGKVRSAFGRFYNLFLIGRNGMHRYNNMDHSMLAAMTAVDNIVAGADPAAAKQALWDINTEEDYHEEISRKDA